MNIPLLTSFQPPEPIIGKLLEPIEKFSLFSSWAPVVVEICLLLAAVFFAIWVKKKRRGVGSKTEIHALKKVKKERLEEINLVIAFGFGLSFVAAMFLWL